MAENTIAVSRREHKYLIGLKDRLYLIGHLDTLLKKDAYGLYDGYKVRSLYFDSIVNEDYMEKIQKADERKRVRLRIYSIHDKTVKFELKRKSFGRQLKETIKISRADAIQIINGNYEVLLSYDTKISEYAYDLMTTHSYRPVSIVEYDRRAYTHEHFSTRITLDNNLKYSDFDYDLFSNNINFKHALNKDKTILEVKYDRFLFEQIQDILKECTFSEKPPSKYVSSRQILK